MFCMLFFYKEKIMSDTIILEYRSKSRNEIDKYHWAERGLLKKQYGLIVRNKMRINKIKKDNKKYRKYLKSKKARRKLVQRAKAVGLEPLPPGRPTEAARRKWMNELKRLEKNNTK